jgi:ArsR family metal-binding transcriptional regulator
MPSDYPVVITRPCVDTPNRFIAESSFGRKLNMPATCATVRDIPDAKCSESLGVAKFDYKDWTIILYRSGRVDLRKIRDEADARAAMDELKRMLAGAFEPEDNVHQNVKA